MKSSTCRSLGVFDFGEDDEISDIVGEKFRNPRGEYDGLLKYNYLECVAGGTNGQTKELGSPPCVDVDAIDGDHSCDNDNTNSRSPLFTVADDCASKDRKSGLDVVLQSSSTSHEIHLKRDNPYSESFLPTEFEETRASSPRESSPGNNHLNHALPESPLSDEPVDMTSDANDSLRGNSPSTSASDLADDDICLDGHGLDHCFDGWEMDAANMDVDIFPDYVVYQDKYCTDARISFSSSCIKIRGSVTYGNQGTFNFQWGIEDVIDSECQWCRRVETAMVKLHVLSKDAVGANDALEPAGIQELVFAVVDPKWPEEQEKITSLDMRYKAIWNVGIDTDMEMDEDDLLVQNNFFSSKSYFPNFDHPFEEVIYPKGDADPVSISKRDVDLLQPETFINDTIIDFYIKYLKNKILPEERHRFHFFNSFFFRKMADLDKDPLSSSEGKAAFLRVRKWTRKVNLFEKDYIFIPVNFNFHWSLIVICHPGEVASFEDENVEKAHKVPCILHMDSIKGTHSGLKNHIQSYLWEEWKEKQNKISEDISSKFLNMRFISLELPQQENSFDCGLFLLHYVELFLEEAPDNFTPFKITKFSSFLNVDWFAPAEASLKRTAVMRLIYDILEHHSRETSPHNSGDEHQSSKFPVHKNKNEADVELLSERYSPTKDFHGNLLSCRASQGIEMTLLSTPSIRSQYVNDPGLVVKEIFDPTTAASLLDGHFQTFDQTTSFYHVKGSMSPIEEDLETGEHFVYSPSGRTGLQEPSGEFGARSSWLVDISMQAECKDGNSSPETSISASDDSLEVGIIENTMVKNEGLRQRENSDQHRSPLMENIDCSTESLVSASSALETTVIEDLENPENLNDCNVKENPLSSCQENPPDSLHQNPDLEDNMEIAADDVQNIADDDLVVESEDQQAAKRMRPTPTLEEERRLTRSLSKDLHL